MVWRHVCIEELKCYFVFIQTWLDFGFSFLFMYFFCYILDNQLAILPCERESTISLLHSWHPKLNKCGSSLGWLYMHMGPGVNVINKNVVVAAAVTAGADDNTANYFQWTSSTLELQPHERCCGSTAGSFYLEPPVVCRRSACASHVYFRFNYKYNELFKSVLNRFRCCANVQMNKRKNCMFVR